jgi:hypothetical protein
MVLPVIEEQALPARVATAMQIAAKNLIGVPFSGTLLWDCWNGYE